MNTLKTFVIRCLKHFPRLVRLIDNVLRFLWRIYSRSPLHPWWWCRFPKLYDASFWLFKKYMSILGNFRKLRDTKDDSSNDTQLRATVICTFYPAGVKDNLIGFTGVYQVCKMLDLDFRIHINRPFILTDYLVPNDYDWVITTEEYDKVMSCNPPKIRADACSLFYHFKMLSKTRKAKYLIVSSNRAAYDGQAIKLFFELLKPANDLASVVCKHKKSLGAYISVSFRFRGLLEDFVEINYDAVLGNDEQVALVSSCIDHLQRISCENQSRKVLVTTDSVTFQNEAQKLDFTYVVPGGITHPACIDKDEIIDNQTWMKIFAEFFLIQSAEKAYVIAEKNMMVSGFASAAAYIGNVPCEVIRTNQ